VVVAAGRSIAVAVVAAVVVIWFFRVLTIAYNTAELLGFWTLAIVQNSKY
jgi:hypothetical protein